MAFLVFRLCENAPEMLRDVCLEKGWKEYDEDSEEGSSCVSWNLWWKSSGFRACDYEDCRPWQRLNHFPKPSAITRKDCLARNLRRMRGVYGSSVFNFAPLVFNLPNDYRKFVSEYSKQKDGQKHSWICKPVDQSRGRGIFLFRNLIDLTYNCAAVVQKYISNPFLISGYKFDLRLHVLVTSFRPLCIYLYHEGLARFGTEKFDLNNLDNVFSHLTNASINKQSPFYSVDKERIGTGCKWSLAQLRTYFHQHNVDDRILWHRINYIIILTLLIQAPEVSENCVNCFELYGFDILIDENLKPWLLEVNFSPALGSDCLLDLSIKKPMLHDILEVLNFHETDFFISSPLKVTKSNCSNAKSKPRPRSWMSYSRSQIKDVTLQNLHSKTRRLSRFERLEGSTDLPSKRSVESEERVTIDLNNNTDRENFAKQLCRRKDVDGIECFEEQHGNHLCHVTCMSDADQVNDSDKAQRIFNLRSQSNLSCCLTQTGASAEFLKAVEYDNDPEKALANLDDVPSGRESTLSKDFVSTNGSFLSGKNIVEDTGAFNVQLCIPEECLKTMKQAQLRRFPKRKTISQLIPGQPPRRRSYLPPLRGSLDKLYIAERTSPRLPKRRSMGNMSDISRASLTRKLSASVNNAGHSTLRKSPPNLKLSPRVGDFILAFPFNEATQKAASIQINTRTVVDEVKKAMQKVSTVVRSTTNKTAVKDSALDLSQPFLGFRPVFNYLS